MGEDLCLGTREVSSPRNTISCGCPPSFPCPLHAFPLLVSLLIWKPWALGSATAPFQVRFTSPSLFLFPLYSQIQYPAQTVPDWLSCKSLATQPQPSHHMLSCSTHATPYCQYKPSFAVGWMTGAPLHYVTRNSHHPGRWAEFL